MHTMPVLLVILAGTLFGVLAWAMLQIRPRQTAHTGFGARDDVLLGLSLLAAFVLGVFLTYMVITIG